jgi:hypothetical protein
MYWALEHNTPFYGWGHAGRVESTAMAVLALATVDPTDETPPPRGCRYALVAAAERSLRSVVFRSGDRRCSICPTQRDRHEGFQKPRRQTRGCRQWQDRTARWGLVSDLRRSGNYRHLGLMQPGDNTIVSRMEAHSPRPVFRLSPNTTFRGPAPPSPRLRVPAILMPSVSRSGLTRPKPAPERKFVVRSMPNESEAVAGA